MKFLKLLLVLLVLAILAVGGFAYWVNKSVNTPHAHNKSNQYIQIPKGSTPADTIRKLSNEGILTATLPTEIYLRTLGDGSKIQAGDYQFVSPITPLEVLKELEKGELQTSKLTIPEGFTRFDIAKRIAERFPQTPALTEKEILALMDDTSLIKDINPNAKNLEGYMYPSTYNFPKGTTAQTVIKTMVEQFRKIWKPEYSLKAAELKRTPQEIVTIASLIETESKFENERPVVASVIYNRLSRGMALGIDQTAVYIAKMENRWDGTIHKSDLESDSPYNTRKVAGLPPGPISSISESSLKAALNPAQTDYIYYVLNAENRDGSHNFYAAAAEFERGKAEYQRWLEEQRKIKREQEAANNQ